MDSQQEQTMELLEKWLKFSMDYWEDFFVNSPLADELDTLMSETGTELFSLKYPQD